MKDLLTKQLHEISISDIERVIDLQYEESSTLELKGPLPVPRNNKDPWQDGEGRILSSTRDEILSEVVAMVNGGGGVVVVGIEETDDDPRRAKALYPVRDCVQLAERFDDMAWNCIDPRLPNIEIKGIPVRKDGAGVVFFRVVGSRSSPHGLSTTKRAYIRRGSRTETMFMREIQEKTLEAARSLDRMTERLS